MEGSSNRIVTIFVQLIHMLRINKKLTLDDLAERTGIDRTYLGLLERGERQPSLDIAIRLANALGEDASQLLSKSELSLGRENYNIDNFVNVTFRKDKLKCMRREKDLEYLTGMSSNMLLQALKNTYKTLDTIDAELVYKGLDPIAKLVELESLSSMIGNIMGSSIAEFSNGLYVRNIPHQHPDLLPQKTGAQNLEIKVALETNLPKGHLSKSGAYVVLRYVLGDRHGNYTRGRHNRGDTVWIWEVKVGELGIEDFDFSNTQEESGKTAVVKTTKYNEMPLVYFDPQYCPHPMKNNTYPAYN